MLYSDEQIHLTLLESFIWKTVGKVLNNLFHDNTSTQKTSKKTVGKLLTR